VVSTTWRANIATVLAASGIADAFELIVAKEDVRTPKPDPEPYLLAVDRLKLPASDIVAIEDSPTGLASARAAGLKVVAVGHRRSRGDWSGDATFIDRLADWPRVLECLGLGD
jgi:beta-phosphoglucomutase-like phosphatase (HAD superfamily)